MRSSSEWKEMTASLPPALRADDRLRKNRLDGSQFFVHRDPQRLEGACRRVDAVAAAGRNGLDGGDQVTGRVKRSRLDDGPRDLA